jgi:hypothetical protein
MRALGKLLYIGDFASQTANASLKCPAGKGTDTWAAMKYGEARILGLRTYPQGHFEVFVRSWRWHDV